MSKTFVAGLALGAIGSVLLAIAAWLTVVYTGAYNVAASDAHADPVRWTLNKTMHQSVAARAGTVRLPDSFSRDAIVEGAGHYAESCVYCHGAPGQEPAEWSRGMRPQPPHLTEAAAEWSAQELHWIIENGFKMTGMPAFGSHHTPEEIMALTAFVNELPGLSAEDYAALTGSAAVETDEQPAAPAASEQTPGG